MIYFGDYMKSYTLALKALARPQLTIARSHHHCSVRLKMVKKALNVQWQSRKRKPWLKNLYWRFVIHIHSFDYQERISWWSYISVHIMRGLSTMCLSVIAMLCWCQGIIIISRSLDGLLGRCRRNMRGTEFNVTIFVLVVLLLLVVTSLVVLLAVADLPCLFFLLRHGSTWLLAIRLLLAGAAIVLFLLRFFIIRLLTFPLWVLFLGFSLSIFVLIRRHKITFQSRKNCRKILIFWQTFKTPALFGGSCPYLREDKNQYLWFCWFCRPGPRVHWPLSSNLFRGKCRNLPSQLIWYILSQSVAKKTKMLCKRRKSKVQILRWRKRVTYERPYTWSVSAFGLWHLSLE